MKEKHSWIDEVTEVLAELGGHATLSDITKKVIERAKVDVQKNKNIDARIRATLYENSSDSTYHTSKYDLFYSVEGIGKGHWGLRDFEPIPENFDYTEDDIGFSEGRAKLLQHILKERNPLVIRNAKEKFKEIHGKVYCEICGFDFFEKYGIIGENFIEGHHTIPLSELQENHKTKIDEIALVCSNCHKMLHRKRPWLTRDELSNLI